MSATIAHSASELQRQWREEGFVIVRGMFAPEEMAELSDEAWSLTKRIDLIDKLNLRCRFQSTYDEADCLWETFDPVIDLAPVCRRFAFEERLMQTLAVLYGEPAELFKDKLIFKQPRTKGYGLHQDWIAWPGFPRSFLTVLIPIDAADEANGCTEVFPGLHKQGSLLPEDGAYHELPLETVDESKGVKLALEPGDVAIFSGFAPHRSAPNRSSGWRRQLYLSYNARSDGGDLRDSHYADFRKFLAEKYAEFGLTDTYYR
jgi:hypothetical protein